MARTLIWFWIQDVKTKFSTISRPSFVKMLIEGVWSLFIVCTTKEKNTQLPHHCELLILLWIYRVNAALTGLKGFYLSQTTYLVFFLRKQKHPRLIYTRGCIESLTEWIKDNLHIVGGRGLAFGFAVIQVILCALYISQKDRIQVGTQTPFFFLSFSMTALSLGLGWSRHHLQ